MLIEEDYGDDPFLQGIDHESNDELWRLWPAYIKPMGDHPDYKFADAARKRWMERRGARNGRLAARAAAVG